MPVFGFIGGGKMATALVAGLVRAGVCAAIDVVVSDPHAATLSELQVRDFVREHTHTQPSTHTNAYAF
jgi:pyrroline-5-carboxylate reductase